MNSVINVQNASQSTRLLASTTLRNMLGTKNLHVNIKRRHKWLFDCTRLDPMATEPC